MISGKATDSGTARLQSRFAPLAENGFYRATQSLSVSTLGIGSYLGAMDESTDRGYAEAVRAAIHGGVNLIDTSLNYRNQRSERAIGKALAACIADGTAARDEMVVCTKAGYLVPGAVPAGLRAEDITGGMHCLTPDFLAGQLERSRVNLGLDTIDVFYLHNPETQLGFITEEEFDSRVRLAFEALEKQVANGVIAFYGAATWDGFRKPGQLNLERMRELAVEAGGRDHHFRFVQLPFNLAMPEAISKPFYNGRNTLELASELGITVIASAALLQARLLSSLPEDLVSRLAPGGTPAQAALQFARSAPGIVSALTGMSCTSHVEENLGIAALRPLAPDTFASLFETA